MNEHQQWQITRILTNNLIIVNIDQLIMTKKITAQRILEKSEVGIIVLLLL